MKSEVRQAITKLEQARAQVKLQCASVKLVEQSRGLVEEALRTATGESLVPYLTESEMATENK